MSEPDQDEDRRPQSDPWSCFFDLSLRLQIPREFRSRARDAALKGERLQVVLMSA